MSPYAAQQNKKQEEGENVYKAYEACSVLGARWGYSPFLMAALWHHCPSEYWSNFNASVTDSPKLFIRKLNSCFCKSDRFISLLFHMPLTSLHPFSCPGVRLCWWRSLSLPDPSAWRSSQHPTGQHQCCLAERSCSTAGPPARWIAPATASHDPWRKDS